MIVIYLYTVLYITIPAFLLPVPQSFTLCSVISTMLPTPPRSQYVTTYSIPQLKIHAASA